MYDVIIIGAGIVGTAVARRLMQYQLSVCLVEKEPDVAMGATKANSAIVHGGYAESSRTQKGRLCYQGRKQFAQLEEELHFGFRAIGSLVITTNPDDLPKLQAMKENGEQNGLPDLEILDKEQVLALEPNVNPEVVYALYCKGAGVCSPYEMAIALAENAVANGAEIFLSQPVENIVAHKDYYEVQTSQQTLQGRFVVNCAGIAAAEISGMAVPTSFGIRPRVGEYLLLARGTGELLNTVVFQMPSKMGKGILVTPTYHGNLLLGPDAIDEDSGYNRSTHVERLAEIYRQARHTTSQIDLSKFIRSFAGVRAVASTDDFILELADEKGFVNVAGIQSPGITSSPAIADKVVEILEQAGLALASNPSYQPQRKPIIGKKAYVSPKEAMELAALPPSPQRLICRCEQVTQAVIEDCLSRGIPIATVDAVKRRTRASMGLCQGNFCRPRIVEHMQALGHSIESQTDVELSQTKRVSRNELLAYIKENA